MLFERQNLFTLESSKLKNKNAIIRMKKIY